MPTTVSPQPPPFPTISGENLTMSVWLNNPPRVRRLLETLSSQRFIADHIFNAGPNATGGAVVYDQILAQNLYTNRDVQAIAPGSEFPVVNGQEPNPLIALVTKYGGRAVFTYEQIERNMLNVLNRELIRLSNTVVRKVDLLAIATLDAAPIQTQTASASWATNTTDIISDIETAKSKLDAIDMGYQADTVLLNPTQALGIRNNTGIRAALPRENMGDPKNIVDNSAADLNGLLGIPRWFVTNRITAGTVRVLDSRFLGFLSDEGPSPYSRVVDDPEQERKSVMYARKPAMGVLDPKACVKIASA